jgi:iron complex transport system ATP-binding protein
MVLMPPDSGLSDGAPALAAQGLGVQRGGRWLLADINCTVTPGSLTVVLGPNGAGKSTLLRALAGEFPPDRGRVVWRGRDLRRCHPSELARLRAVVPQESHLQFPFTALEVVQLGRIPHPGGGDSALDRYLAQEALERVGLGPWALRLYPSLSGGEKQRVHLARALVQLHGTDPGPRALLLDEPTASLDLAHQHAVLQLLRFQARAARWAVLAVLHDLNLALAYADEAVILAAGRIAAAGSLPDILSPALVTRLYGVEAHAHHPASTPSARPQFTFASPAPDGTENAHHRGASFFPPPARGGHEPGT